MLEEIINLYKDEHGYVSNFYEVMIYLQNNSCDEKRITSILLKLVKHNISIYEKVQKENEIQEKINRIKGSKPTLSNKNEPTFTDDDTSSKEEKKEPLDISYYTSIINDLDVDDLELSELQNILPGIYSPDFYDIINTLILHYKKELLKTKQLKNGSEDQELLEYIDTEIKINETIINKIMSYRDSFKDVEIDEVEEKRMNILFDPNTIESDIDALKVEHYSDFHMLLESLTSDILKGVKTFSAIGATKRITEIRYNQARILIDKIDNDTYFAYYIFLKKDCDNYYHNTLIARANSYQSQKKELLSKYNNEATKEEATKEGKTTYEKILSTINPTGKVIKK